MRAWQTVSFSILNNAIFARKIYLSFRTSTQRSPKRCMTVPFEMSEDHIRSFESLKSTIPKATGLKSFNRTKPSVSEANSSMKGLSAAILLDGFPVAFASRYLDYTQSNYRNTDGFWYNKVPHIPLLRTLQSDN